MAFLQSFTVKDLLPAQPKRPELAKLISINQDTTLEEALTVLVKNNILSVPVYNTEEKKYVGILDMYEIMSFIGFASWDVNSSDISLQQFVSKTDMSQPAFNLLGTTGIDQSDSINSLWVQSQSAGIKDTLELMGKGVYRLLVDQGAEFKILTQSDLVRFLFQHWDKFEFKDIVVSEAFKEKQVHKITTTHTALKGFQNMRLSEVNALAVVDEHGKLVGTLSGSDLRGMTHDKIANVLLPVMDFLKAQHQDGLKSPITCSSSDQLRQVVKKILDEKVHRVWLLDAAGVPVGVISLSDVALFVFTQTLSVWYPPEAN